MRVTIALHLEPEDYSGLVNVAEVFYLIRNCDLSEDDRSCFGRVLANKFRYQDVEQIAILVRERAEDCEGSHEQADLDILRAHRVMSDFMRGLWDDIRVHHLGAILMERFDGVVIPAGIKAA